MRARSAWRHLIADMDGCIIWLFLALALALSAAWVGVGVGEVGGACAGLMWLGALCTRVRRGIWAGNERHLGDPWGLGMGRVRDG